MRTLLASTTVGVLLAAVGPGTAADAEEGVDWKQLQGTWVASAGGEFRGEKEPEEDVKKAGHRLVIEGDRLSWYTARSQEPILKGTIKLPPARRPKALDLSFLR